MERWPSHIRRTAGTGFLLAAAADLIVWGILRLLRAMEGSTLQTLSQVLGWLFDENTGEDDFHGLENARDIVERYSGNLSLSGAPGEVILRMSLRF